MREELKILPLGDCAICAVLGAEISPAVNDRVYALYSRLKGASAAGILDIIPTYCSVLVTFDPARISAGRVKRLIEKCAPAETAAMENGRVWEIPVCYGGEYGPDLNAVAAHAGLTEAEVQERHAGRDYRIYMLGFLPGFPYLGGMDESIAAPRLKVPRTGIPAGSVGIAGTQTGIYPVRSPGGWNIIGRTPLKLYDHLRSPAVLYRAGDTIRFVPITEEEYERQAKLVEEAFLAEEQHQAAAQQQAGGVQVIAPGSLTLIEDHGRFGFGDQGIPTAGVMDRISMEQANALVGNDASAAVLECTLMGPTLRFLSDGICAVTGADMTPACNGQPVELYRAFPVKAGDELRLGMAVRGLRTYIAFRGGIDTVPVLSSRSTDLKSVIGGINGRKLAAGDILPIGEAKPLRHIERRKLPQQERKRFAAHLYGKPMEVPRTTAGADGTQIDAILRVMRGPQADLFDDAEYQRLFSEVFMISASSDRMGCRLEGAAIHPKETADIISDGIACGSVQITSAGQPIIMMADHQTAGGYAKIAAVIAADLPILAQLRPGQHLLLQECSAEEAERAYRLMRKEQRAFKRIVFGLFGK